MAQGQGWSRIKNFKETDLRVKMEGSGGIVVGNKVEKEMEKLLQWDKISGRKHKSQREVAAEVQTPQSTVHKIAK